ncbi:hypothetical protein G6F37_001402 [Rhizopus arrhizus]|nr:hypothetical protein G6F38_001023 [Rhizopus arrhizus]KAG1163238.1 hypothetical protein G6F37_001402 [Rhizopus arrhizus]
MTTAQSCKGPLHDKARRVDRWDRQHHEPGLAPAPSVTLLSISILTGAILVEGRMGHFAEHYRALCPRYTPGCATRKKGVQFSIFSSVYIRP